MAAARRRPLRTSQKQLRHFVLNRRKRTTEIREEWKESRNGRIRAFPPIPKFLPFLAKPAVLYGAIFALLSVNSGCGKPDPIRARVTITTDTPEGQFDWAMERLHRALDRFGPPASGGLKIRRTVTHELFPPSDSSPHYTARVTIESTTIFRPLRPTTKAKGENDANRQQKNARLERNPLISDPAALTDLDLPTSDPLAELQDFTGAVKENLLTVDVRVEARRKVDTKVYALVYQDERWQLAEPAETEYEQLLFEYALEN